jgi:hypothetical protein
MTKYLPVGLGALAIMAMVACLAAHAEDDMSVDPTTVPIAGDPNLWPEESYLPTVATEVTPTTNNTPVTALYHRTAWQRARLLDSVLVPLFGCQQSSLPGVPRFTAWPVSPADPTYERGGWHQTDVTGAGGLTWYVSISPAVVVTMVAASIDGSDGSGANPGFPAAPDRPVMKLYRQPTDGSDAELLLTLADETASKAEYESHHTLPHNPAILFNPPLAFAAGEYLVIHFAGHKGANVVANTLKLYGIEITTALPSP